MPEQTFLDLVENDKLLDIISSKTKRSNEDRLAIKHYLNNFELLCVSIYFHIIDEDICKAYLGDFIITRWESAELLIRQVRKDEGNDEEIFEYFQKIAERWKNNPKIEEKSIIKKIIEELLSV